MGCPGRESGRGGRATCVRELSRCGARMALVVCLNIWLIGWFGVWSSLAHRRGVRAKCLADHATHPGSVPCSNGGVLAHPPLCGICLAIGKRSTIPRLTRHREKPVGDRFDLNIRDLILGEHSRRREMERSVLVLPGANNGVLRSLLRTRPRGAKALSMCARSLIRLWEVRRVGALGTWRRCWQDGPLIRR